MEYNIDLLKDKKNINFVPEIMAGSIEEEKIPGYKEDTCIVYIKEKM